MGSRSRGSGVGGLALFVVMTGPDCMINTGHKRIRRERPGSGNVSEPGKIGARIPAVYQMIDADAGRSRLDELVVHEIGDRSPQLLQCGRTKTVRSCLEVGRPLAPTAFAGSAWAHRPRRTGRKTHGHLHTICNVVERGVELSGPAGDLRVQRRNRRRHSVKTRGENGVAEIVKAPNHQIELQQVIDRGLERSNRVCYRQRTSCGLHNPEPFPMEAGRKRLPGARPKAEDRVEANRHRYLFWERGRVPFLPPRPEKGTRPLFC